MSNKEFIRRKKADIYQQLIFAEEELHEAYFDGVPNHDSRRKHATWVRATDGHWMRDSKWSKTQRYLHAAKEMNIALAGIALYGTVEIGRLSEDMENIAQKHTLERERRSQMNEIVRLMRVDLKTPSENEFLNLEWA